MTYLLDINVLIPLAWPNHVHHDKARAWLLSVLSDKKAAEKKSKEPVPLEILTCPITEMGFCRVSLAVKFATDLASTVKLLRKLVKGNDFSTRMVVDSLALDDWAEARPNPKHDEITDIYLAELARINDAVLVTFDGGIPEPHVHVIL